MTYVAWAVCYEGESDAAYYNVLIPRVMEDLVVAGTKLPTIPADPAVRLRRGSIDQVAAEACAAAEAFFLLFIHADTGGHNVEAGLRHRSASYCEAVQRRCAWPPNRCIVIAPRHETEAWILADPEAVTGSLGYTGTAASIGLPNHAAEVEQLQDPKAILQQAVRQVRGRRRPIDLGRVFPAIAQRQDLARLRQAASFRDFERRVTVALNDLGCL